MRPRAGTRVAFAGGMRRDQVLRAASIGLILYGLLGFALLWLGFQIARQTFDQVEALGAGLGGQRQNLIGVLRATSLTLGATGESFDNIDQTLGDARESSRQAAELARGMSQTMS